MPMLLNKHRFALLVALATVSLPLAAQAQRVSPLRDYFIIDKYEPLAPCNDSADCKAHADTATVNNFIAYLGVGMYLPTKFTYKTPR